MALTADQCKFYEDNGYLVVENIIPRPMLTQLRDRITEIVDAASAARGLPVPAEVTWEPTGGTAVANKKAPLRKLSELAPNDEFFRSVAILPQILDIAGELAQSDGPLMLYGDQAFLKPAFEGSEKPLHQDNSYFRISPHFAGVTCWTAIDDSTIDNGCMRYIPGSHKLGLLPHKQLSPAHLTPETPFDPETELPVPIPAGAAIFHHLLCLHCSRANTSPNSRRAWALHIANPAADSPYRPWTKMLKLR
jgi:phytanoyl-CoA hydroxylase